MNSTPALDLARVRPVQAASIGPRRPRTASKPRRRRLLAVAPLSLAVALSGCGAEPGKPAAPAAASPTERTNAGSATPAEGLPKVQFVEVTREAGVDFVHYNGAEGGKLLPETMGAGVAFLDYDGDGDQDLFFVNSAPWPNAKNKPEPAPTQKLFRNDGEGRFEDVTRAVGLDQTFYGQGAAVGDYDGDGAPDLYVTAIGGGRLFRNDRSRGAFVDVTKQANAAGPNGWLTGAAFLDVENDGDLDLFIGNYVTWTPEIDKVQGFQLAGLGRAYGPPTSFGGTFCALLRNDGGRFTDIGEEAGIHVRTPDLNAPLAKSLGVAPFDVDGDGLVDVAVANDTVQNFLFHNLGNGKFEEVAITTGVAFDQSGSPRGGMGIDWAYLFNGERLGLAIGNFSNEMTALFVADEPSKMQFSDVANIHGLGAPTQPPLKFGLFLFDYDLDGRPDLLSTNGHLEPEIAKAQPGESYKQAAQLFWNTGKPGRALFAQIDARTAGPDLFQPIVGRGSAYADVDGDGDLDVVLTTNNGPARLFRNDGGNRNHWIRLNLSSDGKASNRGAIGAKVEVKCGGLVQRRQLFPSKSYLSSVELPLTFGLGAADKVDAVAITWPSGKTANFAGLATDKVYLIDEAAGLKAP